MPRGRPRKQNNESGELSPYHVYFNGKTYINHEGQEYIQKPETQKGFVPRNQESTTFKLELKQVNSLCNNYVCKEPVDIEFLELVLFSNEINKLTVHHTSKQVWSNLIKQVVAYRDKLIKGVASVKYFIPENCHGFGRVNPELALSLGVFTRQLRHVLCKKNWIDIDIENAQPTLLYQFCLDQGLKCDTIKDYVLNREKFFEEVANTYIFDDGTPLNTKVNGKWKYRDILKSLFIVMIFFGGFDRWRDDNKIHRNAKIEDSKLVYAFKQELTVISNTIMKHNETFFNLINMETKVKSKIDNKGEKQTYTNPLGRAMSIFLQDYERRVLDVVFKYMLDNKFIVNDEVILCYDGLMIPKKNYKDTLLTALNIEVYNKLGFNLTFTTKDMKEGDYIENNLNVYIPTEEEMRMFSKEVFNKFETYYQKKKYFERFFYKIRHPLGIIQIYYDRKVEGDHKISLYTYTLPEFNNAFTDFRYIDYKIEGEDVIKKECKFIQDWYDDENIKTSQTLEFYPMNKTEDEMLEIAQTTDFKANLFTGYSNIVRNHALSEDKKDYVKYWRDLVLDLCEGNPKYAEYYENLLALKIQKPYTKIPIGIVMMGQQGAGKNKHIEPISIIIGERHFTTSSKVSDFWGEHAEGFLNKIIVNMNEVEGKDTMDLQGRMKSFITESDLQINIKFQRPFKVQNRALLMMFTNKVNPINIDVASGDRRWFVVKTAGKFLDKLKYGAKYWSKLTVIFETPVFIYQLYNYLNGKDLSSFNAIRDRPITQTYLTMASLNIPKEVLFFETQYLEMMSKYEGRLLATDKERQELEDHKKSVMTNKVEVSGKTLCERYNNFLKEYNLVPADRKPVDYRTFYAALENLNCGIVKEQSTQSSHTTIIYTLGEVLKKLQKDNKTRILDKGDYSSIEEKKQKAVIEEGTEVDSYFE